MGKRQLRRRFIKGIRARGRDLRKAQKVKNNLTDFTIFPSSSSCSVSAVATADSFEWVYRRRGDLSVVEKKRLSHAGSRCIGILYNGLYNCSEDIRPGPIIYS